MSNIPPKPKPLTYADLAVEPYRTNRLLAHREKWIEYERARAERAIEALNLANSATSFDEVKLHLSHALADLTDTGERG